MEVKIDTKEKFHVLTLIEPILTANIAAELSGILLETLHKEIKNVVLKMPGLQSVEESAARELARVQQSFYENSASFVICELQPAVETQLDGLELLELMNITPTESEAWDIVQMEEIERELMENNDGLFNTHSE